MKPLAFFDSGVGGLTVLHEAIKLMPYEHFIYFADSDNIPYGIKTNAEISKLVLDATKFLDAFRPKALVLACNTATGVVIDELRIIYDYPIIGMEPAVKPASELCYSSKILLCATERTLLTEKLDDLIQGLNAEDRTERMSLQDLVTYAEKGIFNSKEVHDYLNFKFRGFEWNEYGSIVLGCTHFIYYKNIIKSLVPDHVQIVDGNLGTVNRIKELIRLNEEYFDFEDLFFISKQKASLDIMNPYLNYLTNQS